MTSRYQFYISDLLALLLVLPLLASLGWMDVANYYPNNSFHGNEPSRYFYLPFIWSAVGFCWMTYIANGLKFEHPIVRAAILAFTCFFPSACIQLLSYGLLMLMIRGGGFDRNAYMNTTLPAPWIFWVGFVFSAGCVLIVLRLSGRAKVAWNTLDQAQTKEES